MNRFIHVLFAAALVFASGCNHPTSPSTPGTANSSPPVTPALSVDTIRARANTAGTIAGSGFVILNHPTPAEASAIRQITVLISANLRAYQAGGFSTAVPAIDTALDQQCPADLVAYLPLAHSLVSITALELDNFFDAHPEWTAQGVDVASIVSTFCDGVSTALAQYGAKGVPARRTYVFGGRGYEWTGLYSEPREFTPQPGVSEPAPRVLPSVSIRFGLKANDGKCKDGKCH